MEKKEGIIMATEFGKLLRKIRIDRDEILKDMAENLKVSSSYLSAIEVGKRQVPDTLIRELQAYYSLDGNTVKLLENAIKEDKKNIKVDLGGMESDKRDLALVFARKFKDLDKDTTKNILRILEGES